MAQAKRVVKFEASKKPSKAAGATYGPRLREASNIIKFRGDDWLKEQIETEAARYRMTVSNYLMAAMMTFINEKCPIKLYPDK